MEIKHNGCSHASLVRDLRSPPNLAVTGILRQTKISILRQKFHVMACARHQNLLTLASALTSLVFIASELNIT